MLKSNSSKKLILLTAAGLSLALVACGATAYLWRNNVDNANAVTSRQTLEINASGEIYDLFTLNSSTYVRKLSTDGLELWRAAVDDAVRPTEKMIVRQGDGVLYVSHSAQTKLIKLTGEGTQAWSKTPAVSAESDELRAVLVDINEQIHLFANGNSSRFRIVLDAEGNLLRSQEQAGRIGWRQPVLSGTEGIVYESNNVVHFESLAGDIHWSADLPTGCNNKKWNVGGDQSLFVYCENALQHYDKNGNLIWTASEINNLEQVTSSEYGAIYYIDANLDRRQKLVKMNSSHQKLSETFIPASGLDSTYYTSLTVIEDGKRVVAEAVNKTGSAIRWYSKDQLRIWNASTGVLLSTISGATTEYSDLCVVESGCPINYFVMGDSFKQFKVLPFKTLAVKGQGTNNGVRGSFVAAYRLQ